MKNSNVFFAALVSALALVTAACGNIKGPADSSDAHSLASTEFTQTGNASYYGVGDGFHGRRTASGEVFNAYGLTAAHRTLQFGTCLLVTNLSNKKSTRVRVNDRGPYAGDRILDLSYGAAKVLGVVSSGVARVRIEKMSCSGNVAATAGTTPADNQSCKVFMSVNFQNETNASVTVQSRTADGAERPCGKSLRISGSGSTAQAKPIATVQLASGNGRVTLQIPLSDLSGISHLYAEAVDSAGSSRGMSDAKKISLNVSASVPATPSVSDSDSTPVSTVPSDSDSTPVSASLSL